MTRITHVSFDLDGTLVDSASDIRRALNEVLVARGEAPATRAAVVTWIGWGAKRLVALAAPHWGEARVEEALQEFLVRYETGVAETTRLFPGWAATLAELKRRDLALSLVTNKPAHLAERLVAELQLETFLPVRVGRTGDRTPKPVPPMMEAALQELGRPLPGTLYVGDSATDAAFAAGLGVPFAAVRWGYGSHDEMDKYPCAAWLQKPEDLLELLDTGAGGGA